MFLVQAKERELSEAEEHRQKFQGKSAISSSDFFGVAGGGPGQEDAASAKLRRDYSDRCASFIYFFWHAARLLAFPQHGMSSQHILLCATPRVCWSLLIISCDIVCQVGRLHWGCSARARHIE